MKFIELFAGIGGFRYGLQNVGVEPQDSTDSTGGTPQHPVSPFYCVYANEFNKYAAQIYERHYGKPDTRDIREVRAEEIPDHDLLTGGVPCQAFSIAGKRGGFEDTRGTLFFEIARILQQKQPSICLLENVKGLLSHENGRTFQTILTTLDELGYDCQWQVLNSKDFGVPQNRERVFIIGHIRGTSRPEVFPIGSSSGKNIKKVGNVNSSGKGQSGTVVSEKGVSFTVSAGGGNPDRFPPRDIGYSMGNIIKGAGIRRLTPTECERLQGFPDSWTSKGIQDGKEVEISDTQRYKCLGNAVTTNVITAIGTKLAQTKVGKGK